MRHLYFRVTIPFGIFTVAADSGKYNGMSYLDFCGKAFLYRYFSPDSVTIERISCKEAKKKNCVSFDNLQQYGEWR